MLGFSAERDAPESVPHRARVRGELRGQPPLDRERRSFLQGFPKDLATR